MNNLCDKDYRNVLNDSPNPILVYGPTGYLKFTNPAFGTLTGFDLNKVIGTEPPFPWWLEKDIELYALAFKNGLKTGSRHRAIKFKDRWGKCFYVDIVTSKLNGNEQSVSNWFDVTNEVLQRQKIEALLKKATLQMETVGADWKRNT
jgi:PAS domain S-box-containing protein